MEMNEMRGAGRNENRKGNARIDGKGNESVRLGYAMG